MISREEVVKHMKIKSNKVNLYPAKGKVYSVYDFVNKNISVLSQNEKQILINSKHLVKKIPIFFKTPYTRANIIRNGKPIICSRSGARSAFMEKQGFKLKGCNPKPGVHFPTVKYKFGSDKSVMEKINFGVLSVEHLLREILAHCFFKENKIRISQKPVCVLEYYHNNKSLGYCLVLKKDTDKRTEGLMDYKDYSIKDLIKIKFIEKEFNINIVSGEINFKGIDGKWYSKEKAKLILNMNFNGGFRGILNSNLGNDIIYKNKLFICDFDTFNVIKIPKKPNYKFIKNFCSWCFVEMLKTAFPVWDYIDLTGKPKKEATKLLQYSLDKNSLFTKYYRNGFFEKAKKLGWNISHVNKAIEEVLKKPIYYDSLSDLIINSEILIKSYKPKLGIYALHN